MEIISDAKDDRVLLAVIYRDGESNSIISSPEILEADLTSGDYEVLTEGKWGYRDWATFSVYDDFSTASVLSEWNSRTPANNY